MEKSKKIILCVLFVSLLIFTLCVNSFALSADGLKAYVPYNTFEVYRGETLGVGSPIFTNTPTYWDISSIFDNGTYYPGRSGNIETSVASRYMFQYASQTSTYFTIPHISFNEVDDSFTYDYYENEVAYTDGYVQLNQLTQNSCKLHYHFGGYKLDWGSLAVKKVHLSAFKFDASAYPNNNGSPNYYVCNDSTTQVLKTPDEPVSLVSLSEDMKVIVKFYQNDGILHERVLDGFDYYNNSIMTLLFDTPGTNFGEDFYLYSIDILFDNGIPQSYPSAYCTFVSLTITGLTDWIDEGFYAYMNDVAFENGYINGQEVGYEVGYEHGDADGFERGFEDGYKDGQDNFIEERGVFSFVINSLEAMFSFPLFPTIGDNYISLGGMIGVVVGGLAFVWILKLIAGG